MNWFYRLKYKYQRYAIQNLAMYVTVIFGIGYLMLRTSAGSAIYSNYLAFYPREVLHGQIWRIVTAVLYPPFANSGLLMGLLGIYIYYNFASVVERMMGDFEYNIYFFGSFLIGELGALLYYLIFGIDAPFLPLYTQFAVFMAFAIMYSDAQVLLFFAIPVKIWYLAAVEVVIYIFNFIFGDSMSRIVGIAYTRFSIFFAFLPIVIFYYTVQKGRSGGNIIGNFKSRLRQKQRQKEWRDQWK